MYQYLILYWRDITEIFFFSTLFYYAALWLKKDRTHNLLPHLYGVIILCLSSSLLNLSSILCLLYFSWPIILMLFILMHQTTLQRNFIALKNSSSISIPQTSAHWLETLLATHLLTLSNNQPVYCIIEHTDALHTFIDKSIPIHASINKELLELIQTSTSFDHHKMIWINTKGILLGINGLWLSYPPLINTDTTTADDWLRNAILYTHNTDSCAFFGNPATHTFTVIIKSKTISNLNAHQLLTLLTTEYKLPLYTSQSLFEKQEFSHDNHPKKYSYKQHTP